MKFRLPAALVIVLSIALVPLAYSKKREKSFGNFRVVEEGVLYGSAQPTPEGLTRAIHDHGFRTVISFRSAREDRGAEIPDQWEDGLCKQLGVRFVRLPALKWSHQRGFIPADANVSKFLDVMKDSRNHPVLIHCFRGIHRTGTFSALYRMEFQGWTNAEAIAEMRECGYDTLDGDHDVRQFLENYRPRGVGPVGQ